MSETIEEQLAKATRERDELKKEVERLKQLLNQVVRASEETRLQLCGYTEEEQKIKSAEVWEQFREEKKL